MPNTLTFTIDAVKRDGERVPPRTKKNSPCIIPGMMRAGKDGVRRPVPVLVPSPAYTEWHRAAVYSLKIPVFNLFNNEGFQTINYPVNCRAMIYRHALIGDALGYYQGLADFLEHNFGTEENPRQIITNDRYIVSWDGSRMLKDADRPRIELTLEPV
jgi:hypothetical protein